jgi:hypothetical protein
MVVVASEKYYFLGWGEWAKLLGLLFDLRTFFWNASKFLVDHTALYSQKMVCSMLFVPHFTFMLSCPFGFWVITALTIKSTIFRVAILCSSVEIRKEEHTISIWLLLWSLLKISGKLWRTEAVVYFKRTKIEIREGNIPSLSNKNYKCFSD